MAYGLSNGHVTDDVTWPRKVKPVTPICLERNILKLLELETSNLVCCFVSGMPSRRTNNFPESGRGLGHVTPTIFGSTVGYPSDSLASCLLLVDYKPLSTATWSVWRELLNRLLTLSHKQLSSLTVKCQLDCYVSLACYNWTRTQALISTAECKRLSLVCTCSKKVSMKELVQAMLMAQTPFSVMSSSSGRA